VEDSLRLMSIGVVHGLESAMPARAKMLACSDAGTGEGCRLATAPARPESDAAHRDPS
jgi:hypothetical protein